MDLQRAEAAAEGALLLGGEALITEHQQGVIEKRQSAHHCRRTDTPARNQVRRADQSSRVSTSSSSISKIRLLWGLMCAPIWRSP